MGLFDGDIWKIAKYAQEFMDIAKESQERIATGECTIPDDPTEIKQLIQEKAVLLNQQPHEPHKEDNGMITIERTDDDRALTCDIMALSMALFNLKYKEDNGVIT